MQNSPESLASTIALFSTHYVDEHYSATGTYTGDDEAIDLYLFCDYDTGMHVYPINRLCSDSSRNDFL